MTFSGALGNAAMVAVAIILPLPGAIIIAAVFYEYRATLSRWAFIVVRALHIAEAR